MTQQEIARINREIELLICRVEDEYYENTELELINLIEKNSSNPLNTFMVSILNGKLEELYTTIAEMENDLRRLRLDLILDGDDDELI